MTKRLDGSWIKMPLGSEIGLGPGDIVLDGDQALPHWKGHSSPPLFGPCRFGPCLLWRNDHPFHLLLSSCSVYLCHSMNCKSQNCKKKSLFPILVYFHANKSHFWQHFSVVPLLSSMFSSMSLVTLKSPSSPPRKAAQQPSRLFCNVDVYRCLSIGSILNLSRNGLISATR